MAGPGLLDASMDAVMAAAITDLGRARTILTDAMSRLLDTFTRLRRQVAHEQALFAQTLAHVNGSGGDAGLVGALRGVISGFVDDLVRIGASSVKIMVELEALRRDSHQVASNGRKIEQIAATTRMLSLNARIEADRLGGVGAVFRVVANEIKALASESANLSKAIRDALATQAHSLSNTSAAVSQLSASDLNQAVDTYRRLDDTIATLAQMSTDSLALLTRIQFETDAALQALQFEDMMSQLLQSVIARLETVRTACRSNNAAAIAELERGARHDTVSQSSMEAGSVELF
jgi:methyl-accepting chemotaxis protein